MEDSEYSLMVQAIQDAVKVASVTPLHPEAKLRELVEPLWEQYFRANHINLNFQPRDEQAFANGRADTVYNRFIIEYKKPDVIKANNAKNRQLISQLKGYIEDLAKEERWKEDRLLGVAFDGQFFLYISKVGRWIEEDPVAVTAESVEHFLHTLKKLTEKGALVPENLIRDFAVGAGAPIALSTLLLSPDVEIVDNTQVLYDDLKRSLPFINAIDYGAVGNGIDDDTVAIQAAINAAPAGSMICFPYGNYKITAPLTISNTNITLTGTRMARIWNHGTGSGFVVTGGHFLMVRDLSLYGNGGAYGVGATCTHGFEFNNTVHWKLDNVFIGFNGGHGIYCHDNGWCGSVINGTIYENGGDGISSRTLDYAAQTGNALSIVNSAIYANAGNGINWLAAGLNVNGCTLEANYGAGILISSDGSAAGGHGFNIAGNFFEANTLGQVKIVGTSSHAISGGYIGGNYMYSNLEGGATALIVCEGPLYSVQALKIDFNSYLIAGATVVAYVDMGGASDSSGLIEAPAYPGTYYKNLGTTRIRYTD
jgi:hypothetical protein